MVEFVPESYRILIVDDSFALLQAVKAALDSGGYQTMTALSGEDALDLIGREGLPHLALVDINMPPGMDGFELCEKLHEFSDVPIIMVTAVGEEETIVQALEKFAEDYITKPFDLTELLARVRRVLLRIGRFSSSLSPTQMVDPHLRVNFANCMVTVDGEDVEMTPTETKMLYILMRSAGEILTTNFIMRRLWPLELRNEGRLRVYIHRLRQKLERTEPKHRYVLAKRGIGYSFVSVEDREEEVTA